MAQCWVGKSTAAGRHRETALSTGSPGGASAGDEAVPQGSFQYLRLGVLSQTMQISLGKTSDLDCCFTPPPTP